MTIPGPSGQIEALLEEPKVELRPHAAVICHPHPQFQGTMLNKVVHTLSRAMNDLRVPVVRFNFRGVGASDGEYGEGIGETEDTLAVADWVEARYPGADLCLLGFSFGGMIASRAALDRDTACLVTVAPAVSRMAGLLDGRQPNCPWLIVQGEADEIVACEEVVEWFNTLAPGPELSVLPDVGHFFHGRLTLLRETVTTFLRAQWSET
ncbi:MAG: alpha/beta hydrolase [Gammaproteobacteria bacterium]